MHIRSFIIRLANNKIVEQQPNSRKNHETFFKLIITPFVPFCVHVARMLIALDGGNKNETPLEKWQLIYSSMSTFFPPWRIRAKVEPSVGLTSEIYCNLLLLVIAANTNNTLTNEIYVTFIGIIEIYEKSQNKNGKMLHPSYGSRAPLMQMRVGEKKNAVLNWIRRTRHMRRLRWSAPSVNRYYVS